MSTITNHYNVAIKSRFYDFLQEDMESVDPQVLIADAEKKREMNKENKSKAKKDKRVKQIAEGKKETVVEDLAKAGEPDESTKELEEKILIKKEESVREDPLTEPGDRGLRGRGSYRRGGRAGSSRTDERCNTENTNFRSNNEDFQRPNRSYRGRPYGRDGTDDRSENIDKDANLEEQSHSGYRGGADRRRPYSRGARFPRGSDRKYGDDHANRTDVSDNVEKGDDFMEQQQIRGTRGRYPRANRGGSNRFPRQNNEEGGENDQNKIGHFEDNADNGEYRGSGRPRTYRGGRRGRGDYYVSAEREVVDRTARPDMEAAVTTDARDSAMDDSARAEGSPHRNEQEVVEESKTEDVAEEVREEATVTMTLEEWKLLKAKERAESLVMDGKETRKANDGQDVFCGMAEYRKGKSAEEQGEESEPHEAVHARAKMPIPVDVRFSRSADSSDRNDVEPTSGDGGRNYARTFVPRGRGGEGVRDGASGGGMGGRGRSRMGTEPGVPGRGRDSNRYRGGRGGRQSQSDGVRDEQGEAVHVHMNLANEEEFPSLR